MWELVTGAIAAGVGVAAWAISTTWKFLSSDHTYITANVCSSSTLSSGRKSRRCQSRRQKNELESFHEHKKRKYIRYPTPEKYKLKPNTRSSYTYQSWPEIFFTKEGTDDKGKPMRKIEMYSIPEKYIPWFEKNLEPNLEMTFDDRAGIENFIAKFGSKSKILDTTKEQASEFGFTAVRQDNYIEFFHDLLYLEEYENICQMNQYNMTEVPMKYNSQEMECTLEVPGLAEKRPNISKNDVVYVRLHDRPVTQYSGWVKEVSKKFIVIKGFDKELQERMEAAKTELLFDVRFTSSRYVYYVQHEALDSVVPDTLEILFPSDRQKQKHYSMGTSFFYNEEFDLPTERRRFIVDSISSQNDTDFVNWNIKTNIEQKRAVMNIIQGKSGSAPYIIFGPPGTGKTVAFVEAILQVKKKIPDSHILVCAQNNGTCDLIASKLYFSGECNKEEILRLVSSNKMEEAAKEILEITNSCPKDEIEKITRYRIIVCTLITAGRIVDSNNFVKSKGHPHTFSHLFIDEAGQASEVQTLIPIAGLLRKGVSQLVLAGDPKQLGPVCVGKNTEKFGLGISLLERLMANFPMYQTDAEGNYDQRFIRQLVKNFRSHEDILKISNKLFYKNKLEPQGVQDDLCCVLLNEISNTKKMGGRSVYEMWEGTPIIFHGVIGEERRDPKSLSMWNREEISKVVDYVSRLLSCKILSRVQPEDIGVIAPYFLQVQKIKQELQRKGWSGIEVGSTETFQGREKRAIIVSTVRSQPCKIKRYSIGFVKDPRRFNVIMTRAQAKLIVIGNPHALSQDESWKYLLETALDNQTYRGCQFNLNRKTENENFNSKFENLNIGRHRPLMERNIVYA